MFRTYCPRALWSYGIPYVAKIANIKCRLPSRFDTPMATTYHPSEDVTKEMNAEGLKLYQELIGILRWADDICRVYILLEVYFL